MKKVILTYGLIAGLIVTAMMAWSAYRCATAHDFEYGMIFGYASMIVAFSMIFVGIKKFRDRQPGGEISFGKAFKVGILITLIASTMYMLVWLVEYYVFIPDFADLYAAQLLAKMKASGATATAIAEKTEEMAKFKVWYKNPLFVVLMTYVEIFPVGLIVTLIAAAVLKRKKVAVG